MAGAFVDGALKGFEMMERHQERKDNKARLAEMDKRNEERYQDSIDWRERQAADNKEWRESQAAESRDYRAKTLEANKQQRQWQQKYQTQQAQWQKDQQVMGVAWQSFKDTGQIPEELEDVMSRNKGMDPRTYMKKEYRDSVKGLSSTLDKVVKTGDLQLANNPTTTKLFNDVFGDKLQASVGQFDSVVGGTVTSVKFAGFVPAERQDGSVALALNVTYKNDKGEVFTEVKPMTKGRTSEEDDPVITYTPQELIGTIKTRAMMADMIERPEYWDKMGAQVGASLGGASRKGGGDRRNEYQEQLNSIQDEMTKALAKIESAGVMEYADDAARTEAKKRVSKLYESRVNQLKKAYGVEVPSGEGGAGGAGGKGGEGVDIDDLSDDELLEQLTGAVGAQ